MSRSTFMSHAHADNAICTRYADALRARGVDLWIDLVNAQKGVDLSNDITRQIERCSALVLMVTNASNTSRWVNSEVSNYYVLYNDKTSYLVNGVERMILPVRVEQVAIPTKVRGFNWIDAVNKPFEQVVDEIALALGARAVVPPPPPPSDEWEAIPILSCLARLDFKGWRVRKSGVEFMLPPTRSVPGGAFTMGSDKTRDPRASDNEMPQYDIPVASFQIGMYPVTVAEYAYAVKASAVREPPESYLGTTWAKQQDRPDHPITCVSWEDVMAYAAWLAQTTQQGWRLPTEAEWEKAARWDANKRVARIYPWGDQWDKTRANTADGGPKTTTSVGAYADKGDASPCGAHDMAGNVWEWTSSIWQDRPPYIPLKRENDSDRTNTRVLHGGSWYITPLSGRAASRGRNGPGIFDFSLGFRLARGVVAGT